MSKTEWTKWSSIAEIVSSVAILVTLVYLAIQTQQNTDQLRSQTRLGLFELGQLEFPVWIEYPELTVFILDSDLEMSLEQKIQLDSIMILSISRREFAWGEFQAGILDQESWNAELNIGSLLLGTKRTRDWWNSVAKFTYDEDFASVVSATIDSEPYHPHWENLADW
ncbi:MAG: hypothetical protein O2971_19505 [Proteobacteria bacterium]|nr:hypothetical protein [Pseudomonadota bacterium]